MKFQNGKIMYFESYRKLGSKLLFIINCILMLWCYSPEHFMAGYSWQLEKKVQIFFVNVNSSRVLTCCMVCEWPQKVFHTNCTLAWNGCKIWSIPLHVPPAPHTLVSTKDCFPDQKPNWATAMRVPNPNN